MEVKWVTNWRKYEPWMENNPNYKIAAGVEKKYYMALEHARENRDEHDSKR